MTSPASRLPRRRRRLALAALVAGLAALAGAPTTHASAEQESIFQDDSLLVYAPPAQVARTLDTLHALGVERIRVSVFWSIVAPAAQSTARPQFDAADPAAYPPSSWDRYDTLVVLARAHGIAVDFDPTSPAPYWATGHPPRADIEKNFDPSPADFAQFVAAAGLRYSGSFVPARAAPGVTPGSPLPRVDFWSVWNEPNQAGWLTPQWTGGPGSYLEAAPRIYRTLVDAAFAGLRVSGHGGDTILIGETAPKGLNVAGTTRSIKPLHFIRQLYCLDDHLRPLTGQQASARGCPASFDARAFVAAHPGLFAATGFSHHPYELLFAPNHAPTDPDYVTIANLPKLSRSLQTISSIYGQVRPGGVPLYLTEFGFLTDPPSPLGVSLAQQVAYMAQSEFISYNNPNVRGLSQFLLVDDAPKSGVSNPVAAFGGTFQTGLVLRNGKRKPSFAAYRLPIFLPRASFRRPHAVRVWGFVRVAPRGAPARVAVQFKRRGSHGGWRTLRTLATSAASRYVDTRVRPPASGLVRLAWAPPAGQAVYSRIVAVTAR